MMSTTMTTIDMTKAPPSPAPSPTVNGILTESDLYEDAKGVDIVLLVAVDVGDTKPSTDDTVDDTAPSNDDNVDDTAPSNDDNVDDEGAYVAVEVDALGSSVADVILRQSHLY
jgi:hypothetical protein